MGRGRWQHRGGVLPCHLYGLHRVPRVSAQQPLGNHGHRSGHSAQRMACLANGTAPVYLALPMVPHLYISSFELTASVPWCGFSYQVCSSIQTPYNIGTLIQLFEITAMKALNSSSSNRRIVFQPGVVVQASYVYMLTTPNLCLSFDAVCTRRMARYSSWHTLDCVWRVIHRGIRWTVYGVVFLSVCLFVCLRAVPWCRPCVAPSKAVLTRC